MGQQVIVRTYKGSQSRAMAAYQNDSAMLAAQGYFPVSQSWVPGEYGCGAFLVALLLCFVLVGILVFIYMLIVKPDGTLSVTYELRTVPAELTYAKTATEKISAPIHCNGCGRAILEGAKFCPNCGKSVPSTGW
jgi:hypothetical protein